MTYGQLAENKTPSMEVNLIINDLVSNARWGLTKAAFKKEQVSDYDLNVIREAVIRYRSTAPGFVMKDA